MDVLKGVIDILRLGERDASNIEKRRFLSNSFIGGPRDMRQRYMDAIALVQRFGKPDLFITMMCNPSWHEIKEHLASVDEAQNRPDLISRDDIDKHQNKLTLFSTYLISTAKVREPLPYGLSVNTFEWVVDRFKVVEQIKEYNTGDPPLPASTRLNTISLANLEQEPRHVEFDVLAVVVSCGAIKFAGIHGYKCRQIVVMDANMHHYIFTLWEDFAEIDGSELAAQIENHPVILAKRIARSSYAGISLTTRYNSIILTNPVYPQVAELTNWVKNNEEMLNTYTERSSTAMLLHDDIIPIGNIETQSAMQYFYVEGKMSFLDDDDQIFYELMCPKCKNVVRTKIIKGIDCGNCQEHTMLTPRHSDDAPAKLFVSSFVEKQDALQLPPLSASANVGESNKRELDNASSPDELKKPTTGSTSSKIQQLECTTPSKNNVSSSKKEASISYFLAVVSACYWKQSLCLLKAMPIRISVAGMDVKVLRVGQELIKETLPLQSGSRLYEMQGLNSNKWYEVKISYPASIAATFTLQLSKGSSGLSVGRKLLNTEKIIFQGDSLQLLGDKGTDYGILSQGGTFVLVNVEPEGIVAKPGLCCMERSVGQLRTPISKSFEGGGDEDVAMDVWTYQER
ncbi:hypothetical protein BC332_21082 [Capsicum chinense]|nr:hypothetical protein BC332_21082 [Capsicum chinense]